MNHRLNVWLLFVVLLGVVSCQGTNQLEPPSNPQKAFLSTEHSQELSDQEAIKQAQSLYAIMAGTTEGLRAVSTPKVKNVLRTKSFGNENFRSSDLNTTSKAELVVVNFENDKGFVLLSSDKMSEPLLGFSNKGSLDPNQNLNPNQSVVLETEQAFLSRMSDKWGRCKVCGAPIPPKSLSSKMMSSGEIPCSEQFCYKKFQEEVAKAVRQSYIFEYSEFKPVLQIKPLVPVEWDQRYPHNMKLRTVEDKETGATRVASTGCVATAISQIMTYHRYPTEILGKTIDWDKLINKLYSSYSMDISSTLHKDMGQKSFLDMKYKYSGSGALSENVPRTLRHYGYKSGELLDYDWQSIKDEIMALRPIYMRGKRFNKDGSRSGHAWVLDGFVILQRQVTVRYKFSNKIISQYNEQKEFVHCNLGWGPGYNGYYLSKAFNLDAGPILDADLTVREGRDFKTDSLKSEYTFNFKIIKDIKR